MNDMVSIHRANSAVGVILPQSIDEIWRIARMAVMGGMAPKSLVDKKEPDEAVSACAIAIMAGAELGLTPLMALRSYAVVNGRPTLWGDGIKAVVRQSGRCEYIRTGSDQMVGWCEAKRSDTGEAKRVEFTWQQAVDAGLSTKTGPWSAGYRDVMMERRATGRCLNDLFADVLGGVVDQQEALDDGPIERTPRNVTPKKRTPPSPPAVVNAEDVRADPPSEISPGGALVIDGDSEPVTETATAETAPIQNAEPEHVVVPLDEAKTAAALGLAPRKLIDPAFASQFLEQMDGAMVLTNDLDTLEEVWTEADPEGTFDGDHDNLTAAFALKDIHTARIEAKASQATPSTRKPPSPPSASLFDPEAAK